MLRKKEIALEQSTRDPFGYLMQMTENFDRLFGGTFPTFRVPSLLRAPRAGSPNWLPNIDVFERDQQLVTKIDLPGMTKNDVKVEVADGYLTISGERKAEAEEKKDDFYRCEREFGSFYRTVPLPEGTKAEDVKATFADGVLEIAVPLPVRAEAKPQKVEIRDAGKAAKTAA